MGEIDDFDIEKKEKRPVFLTVLCILSFVWLGFGVLDSFGDLGSGPSSKEDMKAAKVELAKSISELKKNGMESWVPTMQKLGRMAEDLNQNHYLATIITFLITLAGIYAVYLMMKGAKLGFHMYIVYSLLSIGSIYLFVNPSNVPTFIVMTNVVISGLFIFMYSRNLKWLR